MYWHSAIPYSTEYTSVFSTMKCNCYSHILFTFFVHRQERWSQSIRGVWEMVGRVAGVPVYASDNMSSRALPNSSHAGSPNVLGKSFHACARPFI